MTPSTARLLFFAKFVVAAAVLFVLWKIGGASAYGYAVLIPVTVLSPIVSGYPLMIGTSEHGLTAFFEIANARVPMPFILHEALAGVIPFLALMCASPGMKLTRWASRCAAGLLIIYAAHVFVLLVFAPLLLTEHVRWVNRIIDVTYGFYAVAGFVGLPFALWIVFTRPWETDLVRNPAAMAIPAAALPATSATKPLAEPKRQAAPGKRRR